MSEPKKPFDWSKVIPPGTRPTREPQPEPKAK